ncbi:hypothetical protein ACN38_g9216 [Penicillium nordicum]|uniref:Uncharacterized protein n=1 Tax=Penicillium nordicum TaxID=229535 RepID=A0A0M8P3K0_9EURO|nr:hypothetical protein ACN38_g9216 [Penicillium nordicum]
MDVVNKLGGVRAVITIDNARPSFSTTTGDYRDHYHITLSLASALHPLEVRSSFLDVLLRVFLVVFLDISLYIFRHYKAPSRFNITPNYITSYCQAI